MENQEYLNQIAAKSAPVKPSSNKSSKFDLKAILHSKIFIIVSIAIVVFILLAIIGSALGGNKTDLKTEIIKLNLHVENTSEVIDEYQPHLKSSVLRSYSASLRNVLSKTNSDLTNYLTTKYNYKSSKNNEKKLIEKATKEKDELANELFEAKINGNLDRIFPHKMAFEISKFTNEENAIKKTTKDDQLKAVLDQSLSSLESLYNNFNDFSETNNK